MEEFFTKFNLGAYLNITADEHLNEYIGDSDKRVELLTGFTGSNGLAVTCRRNALFTDSRYFIQAKKELKNYELKKMGEDNLEDFINSNIDIKRVGLNPRHFSYTYIKDLVKNLKKHNIELIQITEDLVDTIYAHKKERIFNPIYSIENYKIYDFYKQNLKKFGINEKYKEFMIFKDLPEDAIICGKTYQEKLEEVRKLLEDDEELIISEMDTICWIFNLRGYDIKYNPLFYSYACINKKEAKIFSRGKINLEKVVFLKYEDFESYLLSIKNKVVVSNTCNGYIDSLLSNHKFTSKVRELQSIKTKEELEGFNLAYILDGIALNRLFLWMNNIQNITEKDVAHKLEEIKSEFYGYKFPSFESIVASGANSAIVHYSAGDKNIQNDEICLLDVGSNYIFGTTDTSRTLFIGRPTKKVKKMYTKVLKGQMRAIRQIYPKNINGCIIDSLTRLDLWDNLENYGHASGHGVGHFLCVHEGPPTLSYNYNNKILVNQVFSVEPGIYYEEEFGVRLENLVYTSEINEKFMELVNITYVPYQLDLIDTSMLQDNEVDFINKIFAHIQEKLTPFLTDKEELKYLMKNTKKLK